MKRVLITGGRDWVDVKAVAEAMIAHEPAVFVHGACPTGADRIAADLCEAWGWAEEPHPANWKRHGKGAGPKRNAMMVRSGADHALAFPTGGPGTADCIRRIEAARIPLTIIAPRWPSCADTDAWKEMLEERVAIMIVDGAIPEEVARPEARTFYAKAFREQRDRESWIAP